MPVTIHSRLLALALSVLLPAALGVVWTIASSFEGERRLNERNLRDTARALSMVMDRELGQRAAIARLLAQSRWLDDAPALTREQITGFEEQAQRALEGMEGWIELRTPDRVLLDTRDGPGAAERLASTAWVETPRVLPLQARADAKAEDPHAAVAQPVERSGRVVLNVLVTVMPHELQRIIDSQNLPAGWVGTVMDDRGVVLARHPGGKANIGRGATADLRTRMAASPEGLFESVSLDGRPSIGYYSLSRQGWAYVSAMPREQFDGLGRRVVIQVGLGSLLLLALAVSGALWASRSIVRPVQVLKSAAARMQAGLAVPAGTTGIVEYDEVARALTEASEAIARGRAELELQVTDAIARTRQAEQRLSQGQRIEALGRLTGGVAHDFNNLLGVIGNSAHLIGRHVATPELEVPLQATQRAVQRGQQLTQHLLRFAGQRPLTPGALDLGRYLPEALDLIRSVLGRHVELSVKVAPDTAPVLVDASELELALINLALNARDAMPRGGALQISARNATDRDRADFADLGGVRPGHQVLITVSDDGIGIEPEVAAHAFEPFFTTKSFGQGSGLGLSQVHGFCTQAGGAVRLASTPGLGTTLLMLLPVPGPAPAAAAAGSSDATAQQPVAGARVLVVDDNTALADVTEALLRHHGARVERAGDAAQALQLVAVQPFDAVLSDVVMPGAMDGLGLARLLRERFPALAVVLISGFSQAAAASEFPFLHKPCSAEDLLSALGRAMASHGRHIDSRG